MPPIIHNIPFNTVVSDDIYLRRDDNSGPNKDLAYNLGSPALRWANIYSVNFTGTSTSTFYADVAEKFYCEHYVTEGDIVCIKDTGIAEISLSYQEFAHNILGVVSKNPGVALNSDAGSDETHPYIALAGRVPCKIIGKGTKGQRIVSSPITGVARVVSDSELFSLSPYCVIGRLLENKTTEEVSLAMVVVGVK